MLITQVFFRLYMQLLIKNLNGLRNRVTLFRNIKLNIYSGQILYISGSNGVGKTTLLRIIAGLHNQYTGDISFFYKGGKFKPKLYCNYLGTKHNMKDWLTIAENLNFWQKLDNNIFYNRDNFLPLQNTLFTNLSSGQKKRVAIERLLLNKRPLWLLDEPFLHLDKQGKNFLNEILKLHTQTGGMALITSHNIIGSNVINLDEFV